jgi:hypothetical protein
MPSKNRNSEDSFEPRWTFRKVNRKIYIFLACFVFSMLLWLLTVFTKEYTTSIHFPTRFLNIPTEKVLVNKLPEKVAIEVSGSGFDLLGADYSAKRDTLFIDARNLRQIYNQNNDDSYFLLLNNQLGNIAQQLGPKVKANKINPDTVKFDFDQKVSKIVPVKLNLKYSFEKQYALNGKLKVHPSFMLIKGPSILLEEIDILETEFLELKGLNASQRKLIPLNLAQLSSSIELPVKKLLVEIPVEKYTETQLELPVKVINTPPGYQITPMPGKTSVRFNVVLSRYKDVSEDKFEVIADMADTTNNRDNYLKISIRKSPDFIINPRLKNDRVEYIMRKL